MTYMDMEVYVPRVTAQQVSDQYARRRLAAGADIARMQEVQMMVNGDVVVPLPELNRNEMSSVPNRAREGLKQFAQRIASAVPNIMCPPVRPGYQNHIDNADTRRRALLGWWAYSKMNLLLRQRARYLQGYAASPVEITWDTKLGVPRYECLNPLFTYPSQLKSVYDLTPTDCIIEAHQPLWWLERMYPAGAAMVYKGGRDTVDKDTLFTVLKWVDCNETVLVVIGKKQEGYFPPPPGSMAVLLDAYENRSCRTPIVFPRMICLDRLQGQMDGIYGMYQTEAVLQALTVQAARKGVFEDPWLVSNPGEEAHVVQIPSHDEAGTSPGIVRGGSLMFQGANPQFQTNQMIDRLAANQNETAGLSSELQGQAPTNVRTGARAALLLSNVIDFPIQEAQELFQESLQEENKIAIAFAKEYTQGDKSFYVQWSSASGPVTYNPKTTFDTDENIVTYPLAGADQAGLVISGGQRLGLGTLSKRDFMELDPMVKDVDRTHDQIVAEKLEDATLMALEQKTAAGAMDPLHIAKIAELVQQDKMELMRAVVEADRIAKEAQASQAPPGAPETQPGLGAPPQPGQAGPPGPQDLAMLLQNLRGPQQGVTPQEVGTGA